MDDEEAPAVHKLFFKEVLAKNPALAAHEQEVKDAIKRIAVTAEAKKDVIEILDEEGMALCT